MLTAPERRIMEVEVTFAGLPVAPLEVRMSRTSPGRYALHEFAKNVFDVRIRDGKGQTLRAERPNLHQWTVDGHDGTVVLRYRLYGDRVDGTYLAVDSTHAHINMPAALMWAGGLEARPARVRFEPPTGRNWRVATQLLPTDDPFTFTAPNVQYLMDSPTEVSAFTLREFTVGSGGQRATSPTFRIALHHDGTDAEADAFAADVGRIVRETQPIFGELPQFDGSSYTFLCDYLPWASGDGMEHRNSTVLSAAAALRSPNQRAGLLGTVAHEFFHAWNMERIRSSALEPFDFDEANMSGELWLGEGFTSYYDDLILQRAKLVPLEATLASYANLINAVTTSPGRAFRSAEDMSRLAPFVDAAVSVDRTAWPNTFISYYTWGAAIGLALDLSLRDRSNGQVTLDDFMRSLWQKHGKPGQQIAGLVATPYTMADLKARLGEVAGSSSFAEEFFAKYIQGHDVAAYAHLLTRAGLSARPRHADKAALLGAQLTFSGESGARVQGVVLFDSPLDRAGVAEEDRLVVLDGTPLTSDRSLAAVLGRHKPGDRVGLRFVRRSGETVDTQVTLDADERVEIVLAEEVGTPVTLEQQAFRQGWLGSKAAR
ncbi:MAG: PDZ domain-containing protein [Acidobacteria bacterium]|nr:PDZ domain-containing protein [Acidobacteriota bacterium]